VTAIATAIASAPAMVPLSVSAGERPPPGLGEARPERRDQAAVNALVTVK
jgi:hypothetical protein